MKQLMLRLSLFIFVLLFSSPALATNYYISTTGDDSNPGTQESPWRYSPDMTSWTGSHTPTGDDVFYLKRGESWDGQKISPSVSGTLNHPITYGSTASWGSGALPLVSAVYGYDVDYITIDGLQVRNNSQFGYGSYTYYDNIYLRNDENWTITNCYSHDAAVAGTPVDLGFRGSRGILADTGTVNLTVSDTTVEDCTGTGIMIRNCTGTITVSGCRVTGCALLTDHGQYHQWGIALGGDTILTEKCYVYNSGKTGIDLNPNSSGTSTTRNCWVEDAIYQNISQKGLTGTTGYIYGNILYNSNRYGILLSPRNQETNANFYVYNNTICDNRISGILAQGANVTDIRNNIVYDNNYSGSTDYRRGQLTFDPLYDTQVVGGGHPMDGLICDYNDIYPLNGDTGDTYFTNQNDKGSGSFSGGYDNCTIAQWVAWDYDGDESADFSQNGVQTLPGFNDYDNKDFTIPPASLQTGTDIGNGYVLLLPDSTFSGQDATTSLPSMSINTADPDDFTSWPIGAFLGGVEATGTVITGLGGGNISESSVVPGGETIILTCSGTTWNAFDNTIRAAIVAGMDSAQSEATGWDALIKADPGSWSATGVVRDSDTQVTITLPAAATYAITANETITITVPASAVASGEAIIASPTVVISNEAESSGGAGLTQGANGAIWTQDPNGLILTIQ